MRRCPRHPLALLGCSLLLLLAVDGWCHQEARLLAEFGGKGTGAGGFPDDTFFFADALGFLYVSDATTKRIQKFDANGVVVLEIDNSSIEGISLSKPRGLTVDALGNIYVVDRAMVPMEGGSGRQIFEYRLVVRKFSSDGDYLTTLYHPFHQEQSWNDAASLAINPQRELAAIAQLGDLNRTVLLAMNPSGNLLIEDRGRIFELDEAGSVVRRFSGRGGRAGETHDAASISVGPCGSVYLADTRNDRIAVYDAEGGFSRTFGVAGTRDGELVAPTVVSAQMDGSVLVGDAAVYTRIHTSELPVRDHDPSPALPQSALPLQYRLTETRLFTTLMHRVSRFYPDGAYDGKILLRFPTESAEDWHYELRAIGADGRLYYQHTDSLVVRVYGVSEGIVWDGLHKTLTMRYDVSTLSQEIDNPDLDAVLGLGADYRARGFLFRDMSPNTSPSGSTNVWDSLVPQAAQVSSYVSLNVEYDWDESRRFGASGGFYVLRSRTEQLYQAEAGLDPERSFPQDDSDVLRYDSAELQVRWEQTLNQDPYRYRTMSTYLNMSFGKTRSLNEALAKDVNLRTFLTRQRFFDWEAGLEYDLSPGFYGMVSVLRGPARGGFDGSWTYIDETGALFARGFNEGRETRVQFSVEGYL